MSETYCGKSCEGCEYKAQLFCKGCKNGPGYILTRECDLAKCCEKHKLDTCESCNGNASCWMYKSRDYAAQNRLMNRNADKQRAESRSLAASVLSKWLWVLFWIEIFINAVDLLDERLFYDNPTILLIALILTQVLLLAMGLVFLKMSKQSRHYKIAGIVMLILVGYNLLKHYAVNTELSMLSELLTLPALVLSIFGLYHECAGHSEVTLPLDRQLSEKWDKLWKWYIGIYTAEFVSAIVTILFDAWLGLILLLVGTVAAMIVGIVAIVLLHRSAELFRTQNAVLRIQSKKASYQPK